MKQGYSYLSLLLETYFQKFPTGFEIFVNIVIQTLIRVQHTVCLLLIHVIVLHTVPPPNVTISPSSPIQAAMVGGPQVINCIVTEVSGVVFNSGIIIWSGPNGDIMNSSRTMIMEAYNSGDNTYASSLQFTYLMEGDNGTYTCNFMAGEISVSQSVELPVTSKLSFINCFFVLGEVS